MKFKISLLFLVATMLVMTGANFAQAKRVDGDGCFIDIPQSLRAALFKNNNELDFKIGKYDPEEHDWINSDMTGCYSVASGDYDGDRKKDYALLMVKPSGEIVMVTALARKREWVIEVHDTSCDNYVSCIVYRDKPGVYEHTESFEPTPPDQEKIVSKYDVIVAGFQFSLWVFAYKDGKWIYTIHTT